MHPRSEEIERLIDGEVDASDSSAVADHLSHCQRCQAVARRIRRMSDILSALGRAEAPEGLQARIESVCAGAYPVEAITCGQCLELASAYLDGELGGPERESLEAHLFTCAECYRAYRQMERTSDVLRAVPAATVPANLQERIAAAVERERRPVPNYALRRAVAAIGSLAAAAALLAALVMPRGGTPAVAPEAGFAAAPEPTIVAEADVEALDDAPEMIAEAPVAPEEDAAATDEDNAATTATRVAAVTARTRTSESTVAARSTRETPRETAVASVDTAPAPAVPSEREAPRPAVTERPRTTERPRPAIAPAPSFRAPEPERAPVVARVPDTHAVTPAPSPGQAADGPEPVVATTPRRAPVSVEAPAPRPAGTSVPVPVVGGSDSRIAVVPRQRNSRTLYRGSEGPDTEAIARATAAVNSGQRPQWDAPSNGIELR